MTFRTKVCYRHTKRQGYTLCHPRKWYLKASNVIRFFSYHIIKFGVWVSRAGTDYIAPLIDVCDELDSHDMNWLMDEGNGDFKEAILEQAADEAEAHYEYMLDNREYYERRPGQYVGVYY